MEKHRKQDRFSSKSKQKQKSTGQGQGRTPIEKAVHWEGTHTGCKWNALWAKGCDIQALQCHSPPSQRRSLSFRIVTRVKYPMEAGYLALGVANRARCFLVLAVSVLTQVITPKEEVCSGFHKEFLLGGWMDVMHLNSQSSMGALKCVISCLVAAFRDTVRK